MLKIKKKVEMGAWILVLIFLIIRFTIPGQSLPRLQEFAPMYKHKWAYYLYQLSNLGLMILPILFSFQLKDTFDFLGLATYLIGLVILIAALVEFKRTDKNDFAKKGIYRLSRHPIYLAYFAVFLGVGVLIKSWIYLILLVFFQLSSHFIILAEEEFCLKEYVDKYKDYIKKVRRYF